RADARARRSTSCNAATWSAAARGPKGGDVGQRATRGGAVDAIAAHVLFAALSFAVGGGCSMPPIDDRCTLTFVAPKLLSGNITSAIGDGPFERHPLSSDPLLDESAPGSRPCF